MPPGKPCCSADLAQGHLGQITTHTAPLARLGSQKLPERHTPPWLQRRHRTWRSSLDSLTHSPPSIVTTLPISCRPESSVNTRSLCTPPSEDGMDCGAMAELCWYVSCREVEAEAFRRGEGCAALYASVAFGKRQYARGPAKMGI